MAKESRSTAGMGGGKSKSHSGKKSGDKKRVHEMRIRHGASGGYIVSHHMKAKQGEQMEDPEEHVVPDMDQLQQHVAENMPDDSAEEQGGPAAAAPPPAAGGAAPGPAGM